MAWMSWSSWSILESTVATFSRTRLGLHPVPELLERLGEGVELVVELLDVVGRLAGGGAAEDGRREQGGEEPGERHGGSLRVVIPVGDGPAPARRRGDGCVC